MIDYYSAGSLSAAAYDLLEDAVAEPKGDVAFYLAQADGANGPILDLGTGTGRIAWPLAAAGHAVVGLDLAPAMLAQAEAKRKHHPPEVAARVSFAAGDMANFELGRRFARIFIPFRSFNHLLEPAQQRACLACIHRHLAPGGRAVLHLVEPAFAALYDPAQFETMRRLRVRIQGTDKLLEWFIEVRSVDQLAQILRQTVRYTYRVAEGPVLREQTEEIVLRWSSRPEMRYLFELCGLAVVAEHFDFLGGPPRAGAEQIWIIEHAE